MPTHQAAAAVLVVSRADRVLMVASPYRPHLVLPGGVIELDESPAAAAAREVQEETGLVIRPTRLLVIEHLPAAGATRSGLRFVFDADPVDDDVALVRQPGEVSALLWLAPSEAVTRHVPRGRRRLEQALIARASGASVYLDQRVTLVSPGQADEERQEE